MARVVVIGATGYIGGRLVPRLLEQGHEVRCVSRDPRKLKGKDWSDRVEAYAGDVLERESLPPAFENADVVYYLVHSMGAGEEQFEELDRKGAQNVADAAGEQNAGRLVYLGGLGKRSAEDQSPHLRSRHEVGDILRSGSTPVTEFRAAIIVGSGSISFELIHHLVNRLPVMICPRWVYTRTQPLAIADLLQYLIRCIDKPETAGQIIDIGGPEVMTYRDMMIRTAKILGLRRYLIQVPVLTPRLSSYWVNLVTPIRTSVANALIESLRYETVCENDLAEKYFELKPLSFDDAVRRALARVRANEVETAWTDAAKMNDRPPIDPSHFRSDVREVEVDADASTLFRVVSSIGGKTGWYYADWLWKIRGYIDQQFGGVGLRRGRRHPEKTAIGEALDFWRVEEYVENEKMLLRAEMRVWGSAWLEFNVEPKSDGRSKLTQIARYYPRGLIGLTYWYTVYPIHAFVFRGMAREIGRVAEDVARQANRAGEVSHE